MLTMETMSAYIGPGLRTMIYGLMRAAGTTAGRTMQQPSTSLIGRATAAAAARVLMKEDQLNLEKFLGMYIVEANNLRLWPQN